MQYFLNQETPSCLGTASSCIIWPCLAMPCHALSFYLRPVLAFGYCRCLRMCVCVSVNHELLRAIIHQPFKLGSPNLVQRSKTPWLIHIVFGSNWPWPSRSNLTSNSKLTPFWAWPSHYSPPILVRISKLGQEMHFSTVKIPVNSGLDWPWTSPSFLIPKPIFFALWRCALRLWNSPWFVSILFRDCFT